MTHDHARPRTTTRRTPDHDGTTGHDRDTPPWRDGGHGGHGGHGDHVAMFRTRFWWNLLLAVPVVVFSEMFADLVGYDLPSGTAWISPVFGTIIFFYGGWPFLNGALRRSAPGNPG